MPSVQPFDPIKFEVIRSALVQVTEEMAAALRRSAYSTNIKTRQDFSCAFFDKDCRPIAQAFTQPVHLGSFVELIPRAVRAYGPENIGPGDMIVVNDPYSGGSHLNDTTVFAPVFWRAPVPEATRPELGRRVEGPRAGRMIAASARRRGAGPSPRSFDTLRMASGRPVPIQTLQPGLIGFVASLAHHVDVGGGAPASIGPFQEIYQEGIIIQPVKLVEKGEIVEDIFKLILAQIRSKRITAGDFRAQIAANLAGIRRLTGLIDQHGLDTFNSYVEQLLDYTARRTQAEIARLPRGTFEAEGQLDYDGFTDKPVKLKVKITIGPETSSGLKSRGAAGPGGQAGPGGHTGVFFDLTGCDPQRRAPVNSTYAMTFSACAYALRALMDKDLPINHGFYRFVKLNAPRGTVVNAVHPGAVVGGWETQIRVNDLMFKALSQGMPEAVAAGCKAMMAQAGFGVLDRRTGEYHCNYEALAGGYGGRATKDGPDAVQGHGQNTENAPVEETETNYPVRITRLELIENSEGPGKFRGGLGLRRDYHFPDDAATFTILSDRDVEGPWGLFGGLPGEKAHYILNPDGPGKPRALTSKCVVQLKPGDTVSFQTPGGGGYGPPHERDPQLMLKDVRDGKVSVERARDFYGVDVDTKAWLVENTSAGRERASTARKKRNRVGNPLPPRR